MCLVDGAPLVAVEIRERRVLGVDVDVARPAAIDAGHAEEIEILEAVLDDDLFDLDARSERVEQHRIAQVVAPTAFDFDDLLIFTIDVVQQD